MDGAAGILVWFFLPVAVYAVIAIVLDRRRDRLLRGGSWVKVLRERYPDAESPAPDQGPVRLSAPGGFEVEVGENPEAAIRPLLHVVIRGPLAPIVTRDGYPELRTGDEPFDASVRASCPDEALALALLDPATRAEILRLIRSGGRIRHGHLEIPVRTGTPETVENLVGLGLRVCASLRWDGARTEEVLLERFRDIRLPPEHRRRCLELLIEREPDAARTAELLGDAAEDPDPGVRSLARLMRPESRIFHVQARNAQELATEIAATRPAVRRGILDALAGVGAPAEDLLLELLRVTDGGDPEAEEVKAQQEQILALLAASGTPRGLEALHAFVRGRAPGRASRSAEEAIARIRRRHPESAAGSLSIADPSSLSGALSETAPAGALSGAEGARKRGQTS